MKEGPEFGIVGNASEEEKNKAREGLVKAFLDNFSSLTLEESKELKAAERIKTEEELVILSFANYESNRLMIELGVEPYDVYENNHHIVPRRLYEKIAGPGSNAITFYTKQGGYIRQLPVSK